MPTQTVLANGIRQAYEVHGTRGPWVTLVHGSADNQAAWRFQLADLSKRYRVLTYDLRGHGETETPDAPVSQATFVEDLRGLLDALKIRQTGLVGYSMGGGIARDFAATYPERVWALVLSNGGRLEAPADPSREAETRRMREQRIEGIRKGGMNTVFEGWITSIYTPEFVAAMPETIEWHRALVKRNDPEKYIRILEGAMAPAQVDLKRITMPTLIIVGAGDEYTGPQQGKELAEALTGTKAKVVVFASRHGSPFDRPNRYNRLLLDLFEEARPRRRQERANKKSSKAAVGTPG
jgi:pimeloyl-ACP methyl ester carboxylesterase